jgi:hypothetical protein
MSEKQPSGSEQKASASVGPTSSNKEMLDALDSLASSDKLRVLSFLGEQLHAEQSHYWNRFAALAVLHAGLLVVGVEAPDWARVLTSLFGIGLAVVWILIQKRSRDYVERWKPAFHSYRREQRLLWNEESTKENKIGQWSSTKLAGLVPWALLLPWSVLLVLALKEACRLT